MDMFGGIVKSSGGANLKHTAKVLPIDNSDQRSATSGGSSSSSGVGRVHRTIRQSLQTGERVLRLLKFLLLFITSAVIALSLMSTVMSKNALLSSVGSASTLSIGGDRSVHLLVRHGVVC